MLAIQALAGTLATASGVSVYENNVVTVPVSGPTLTAGVAERVIWVQVTMQTIEQAAVIQSALAAPANYVLVCRSSTVCASHFSC